MDAPTIPVLLEVGDVVQATRLDETPEGQADNVTVATFTVDAIQGLVVSGSPVLGPLDPAEGWHIELVSKALVNLALPTRLAEIAAWSRTHEVLHLMGKGTAWRDVNTGQLVELEMLQGWMDWEDWDVLATAYRDYLSTQQGEQAEPETGEPVWGNP